MNSWPGGHPQAGNGDLPAALFIIMVEPKLLTWPSTG